MTYLVFFFQAEDGIRDLTVTGVQTCALPILVESRVGPSRRASSRHDRWRPEAPDRCRGLPSRLGGGLRAVLPSNAYGRTRLRGLTEPGAGAAGRVRVDKGETPARRLGRREGVADLSTVFRDREIISGWRCRSPMAPRSGRTL